MKAIMHVKYSGKGQFMFMTPAVPVNKQLSLKKTLSIFNTYETTDYNTLKLLIFACRH